MATPIAVSGGSVAFEDLGGHASPSFNSDRKTRTIKRTGKIAWANADALIAECFPAAPALPGAYPTAAYLYVKGLSIKPFHPDPGEEMVNSGTNPPTYTHALAEIEYSTLDYDASDLIERQWKASGEVMALPGTAIRWAGDADGKNIESDEIDAGIVVPHIDYDFTFHRVTTIPWTEIIASLGTVNDGTFEDAAAEELLFMGAQITFKINNQGTTEYTLSYAFKRKVVKDQAGVNRGWNHFFDPITSTWKKLVYRVKPGAAERNMYEESDFSDLF